jgi:Dyp-type peroxidase family
MVAEVHAAIRSQLLKEVIMGGINQNKPQFDAMLSCVQGNILKGHGRDHTANVFLQFHPSRLDQARAWLREYADQSVTSAKRQLAETERFKRHKVPGGLFAGLYVTWAGYEYFQVAQANRPALPDSAFALGMKQAQLMDPVVATWDSAFRDLDIHCMVILGHDDKNLLSREVAKLIAQVRALTVDAALADGADEHFVSSKIGIEYGNAIRNANGDGLEHFGYVDGISQPLFFTDELLAAQQDAVPAGAPDWDAEADLSLVLVADHPGSTTQGSYFVFRKLEQNVRAFKLAEHQLAVALGLNGDQRELAGALLVGRFEDGTPVTLSAVDGMIGSGGANNFDYHNDSAGLKCPFHAHVRKTNPRGSGGAPGGGESPSHDIMVAHDKRRIMARRGIPYGLREVSTEFDCEPEQFPVDGPVGLLFQSFQADLAEQFEFIQKSWANADNFPFSNPDQPSGIDPVIGQSSGGAGRTFNWPTQYGQAGTVAHTFAEFVTMRGGEYFFAPSKTALMAF